MQLVFRILDPSLFILKLIESLRLRLGSLNERPQLKKSKSRDIRLHVSRVSDGQLTRSENRPLESRNFTIRAPYGERAIPGKI